MAYQAAMQEETMRKGPWLEEEDERLATFVTLMGERRWDAIARESGLRRSGKSCRLRWMNYLRPDLKHGQISAEEELVILQLHERWGNKWAKIARRLPGRTDNEIKNYWRTHMRKKAQAEEQEKVQSDLNTQTTSFEYHGSSKEDMLRTSEHSVDVVGWSEYAFLTSPYEARLSDWISGSSNNQDTLKHQECNILDSWFYNPAWISGECNSVWDYCSVSPWDVEQASRGGSFIN